MLERIDRADDPRIAEYQGVVDSELVRRRGLFIAEGRLVVRRVIADDRYLLRSILVNDAARRDLADALERLDPAVPVFLADAADFRRISGYNVHRGCLALVERPRTASLDETAARGGTIVVLERVTNADNVGGVFRNAAALGAASIVLSPGCCDPFYRKAVRTSMGAVLEMSFAVAHEWPGALARLSSAGFTIVALCPDRRAEPLDIFAAHARPSKLALLVGTEGSGLTKEAAAAADVSVCIPMTVGVDSLNLSVAAGIALYALAQR